ncbi:MAG: glycerol-3-phosphate 1-O-acyltransferase PlsY [Desulfarculaceae bacterium]|nr:glycerol-3-phosphate 1-O-acyltransferase PlsY [Desulfarculaceae bacterium]MCF8071921.1 glycerol-3-phosphate 1-O-acyltransferase PlsY [Desulfarculaceae bacterium]MCF8103721.1 glycerol-3-phosphate 1-O-acyltransferase PlsY [Desulfarculaceae bacterium]MCF8114988.1 glycerol-3-phosphate 1-O-acyltransferase PlsY [Desulfarculaceae bacterium]
MTSSGLGLVLGGYLLGAVPFGLLVARFLGGVDPRQGGSGNIGATNVSRQAGRAAGVLTLVLDVAKGAVPTALALDLLNPAWAAAVGLAAFVGHCWPVYLRFKGGKGVATFLGALLGMAPWAALASGLVLILVAIISRHMSLGSMAGGVSSVFWLWLLGAPVAFMACASLMSLMIIYKHRTNITRLKAGEEHGWR